MIVTTHSIPFRGLQHRRGSSRYLVQDQDRCNALDPLQGTATRRQRSNSSFASAARSVATTPIPFGRLQRGWCSQTIPRTERTSVARNRILFSDDTVLSVATGSASSNLRCSSHRLQTCAGDPDPGNAHRPDTPAGRSPPRRSPAQAGNAFPPPARRAVTVTHILPCTIPLSPPPLTSGRAEPVRCQRPARTPQAHCTTRRDYRDAQARTLLFGRAEPIATRPLSGKPPRPSHAAVAHAARCSRSAPCPTPRAPQQARSRNCSPACCAARDVPVGPPRAAPERRSARSITLPDQLGTHPRRDARSPLASSRFAISVTTRQESSAHTDRPRQRAGRRCSPHATTRGNPSIHFRIESL